jgi:hypothetical protein
MPFHRTSSESDNLRHCYRALMGGGGNQRTVSHHRSTPKKGSGAIGETVVTACVVLCFFFEIEKSRLPFWGPIRNPSFALTTISQVFHVIDSVNYTNRNRPHRILLHSTDTDKYRGFHPWIDLTEKIKYSQMNTGDGNGSVCNQRECPLNRLSHLSTNTH